MADPSFDRLMMEASAAAYNVEVNANGTATLTGSDPDGIAYLVDATSGAVQNTLLGAYGYKVVTGFDETSTGFKGVVLSRDRADGSTEWIFSFTGTEPGLADIVSDLQLGWNQWNKSRPAVFKVIRERVKSGDTIHFAGHSLGGGLAEYATYFAKDELGNNVDLTLTTFNSLGVLDSIAIRTQKSKAAIQTTVAAVPTTHFTMQGTVSTEIVHGLVGDDDIIPAPQNRLYFHHYPFPIPQRSAA